MQKAERVFHLNKIEEERNSKVIVYITSDRQPLQFCSGVIATDILTLFYTHLKKIGKADKISLCIRSSGGNLDAPWPLVNLIREYCKEFEIIVLSKALSAGTLIALGANKIVMTPIAQLSPIDPKKNIVNKSEKQIGLEVEDVISFINLAKEKIGLTEQTCLSEILKSLVNDVPTYALGSVNRTHSLIRSLSSNLLMLHLKDGEEGEKQKNIIVEYLTEKLFSHLHLINRKEAKETVGFGDIIEYADNELEILINNVDDTYSQELELTEPFIPLKVLGENATTSYTSKRAILESIEITNTFVSELEITKIQTEPEPQVNVKVKFQGWK
ncbi:MAG: ATP-dependent Clp protease proteolytic subunit [Candidatus Scalindua rubra]|uniref:Serine dehydrogenase proteinase n=1 Tax=Candidatus Scalindua brodae TaxID=237368 RepID=A0A0B0EKI7_9BACT|nr:MAG: hypothetical protein SCABRO_01148 [Candidatus Scalindua brodae]MBZ0109376.1 ATP-dependent Clp protease proteolytic subunit [Candidatus Scalindua rubra]